MGWWRGVGGWCWVAWLWVCGLGLLVLWGLSTGLSTGCPPGFGWKLLGVK